MRPVTLNGYNYANANPVFYVDPTGEAAGPIVWCFGVAIAIPDPGLAESACALFAVGAIGVTLVVAGPDAAQQIIDDVVDLAETCINAFRRTIPQPKAIEHSVPRFGPKPIPQPQPEPQPERKVDFLPIPQDIPDNPNLIRVRHYSQAIGQIKTAQEIRSGMSGPLVFIEHPITTSRDAASIQQTTQSFFRPLNGTGGFVEFNVDLNKWVVAQDPNLPWVPNAKVIHPITHQGTIYMKGATMYFPLNEPIVMPTFYNWKGEKMP